MILSDNPSFNIRKIGGASPLSRSTSLSRHAELDSASGEKGYDNQSGFRHPATLEEVKKQDYKLTPGIYVGSEAEEDDGIPFEEKMEGLKAQLMEQFEKSSALQERIKENLNRI